MTFADPYKICLLCLAWVDAVADQPGPIVLVPCGCRSDYRSVCPSWGPAAGCRCTGFAAAYPHDLVMHERRHPEPGDTRTYGGPAVLAAVT